jgi:hypothetical protein
MFITVGLFFLIWAQMHYQTGSAVRMGPGYFPSVLGGLLAFLGALVLIDSFVEEGPKVAKFHFRPLLFLLASGPNPKLVALPISPSESGSATWVRQTTITAALQKPLESGHPIRFHCRKSALPGVPPAIQAYLAWTTESCEPASGHVDFAMTSELPSSSGSKASPGRAPRGSLEIALQAVLLVDLSSATLSKYPIASASGMTLAYF